MQSPRVYFNNIGSICTDSLRHGNGLSALLLLTRAAKSSAAKSSASKTRSMESRLNGYYDLTNWLPFVKPALHGACFGAVSAPTLSVRVPRRARAAFEKERFHYEHRSCFYGRRLPRCLLSAQTKYATRRVNCLLAVAENAWK